MTNDRGVVVDMIERERWRGGLRLTSAQNLEVHHALESAKRARDSGWVRRLQAILLTGRQRWTQHAVATALRVCANSVTRWVMTFVRSGASALRTHKARTGPKCRLSDIQLKALRRYVTQGPDRCGFDTGVWDGKLVAELIRRKFHVNYSHQHVRKIMHRLGLSRKRPKRISSDASVYLQKRWLKHELPAIQEAARKDGGVVAVEDEATFRRTGTGHTTWGPIGEDIEVRFKPGGGTCKVFGATTLDAAKPQLSFRLHEGTFNTDNFTVFLEQLAARYSGEDGQKLHVILDGASHHVGAREWAMNNSERIELHFLPPHSPRLNPQEQVWEHLKRQSTHNRFFRTTKELRATLRRRLNRFQGNPAALRGIVSRYT